MKENQKQEVSVENLQALKAAHDYHATVVHTLKTRVQFYHEEFHGVQALISFYEALRDQVRVKIEEIEPPQPKEPQKPMVVDLPVSPKAEEPAQGDIA